MQGDRCAAAGFLGKTGSGHWAHHRPLSVRFWPKADIGAEWLLSTQSGHLAQRNSHLRLAVTPASCLGGATSFCTGHPDGTHRICDLAFEPHLCQTQLGLKAIRIPARDSIARIQREQQQRTEVGLERVRRKEGERRKDGRIAADQGPCKGTGREAGTCKERSVTGAIVALVLP